MGNSSLYCTDTHIGREKKKIETQRVMATWGGGVREVCAGREGTQGPSTSVLFIYLKI